MGEVHSIRVTLETVTPLFLGGAEPRGEPELRAPSFRGAMRYWLRAALGGVIGDTNLGGLHQLERIVFGSPDFGSPINTRLAPVSIKTQKAFILPHKKKGSRKRSCRPFRACHHTTSQLKPGNLGCCSFESSAGFNFWRGRSSLSACLRHFARGRSLWKRHLCVPYGLEWLEASCESSSIYSNRSSQEAGARSRSGSDTIAFRAR